MFDGDIDLADYNGNPDEHKTFCCGMVYGNELMYSIFIVCDNEEDALDIARSFKLIDIPTGEDSIIRRGEKQSSIPPYAVSWQEAYQCIGETVTIYGPVVEIEYAESSSNQPTFIDIGAPYPDENRLTVVIWGEDRNAFPEAPELLYEGKTICITGEVYLYDNVCNIKAASPSQIEIL